MIDDLTGLEWLEYTTAANYHEAMTPRFTFKPPLDGRVVFVRREMKGKTEILLARWHVARGFVSLLDASVSWSAYRFGFRPTHWAPVPETQKAPDAEAPGAKT